MTENSPTYRLGVDIGGTFTDIVLGGADGVARTIKVASTTADYSIGIVEGISSLLNQHDIPSVSVDELVHATTVATNAILEEKGVKTGLITTRGFRDVLELRRLRVPELYNISYRPPRPLVDRRLRLGVVERMGADGNIVSALDEDSVRLAIDRLVVEGVEAVAVCLLHSYLNPEHERRVGEMVREYMPDTFLSLSVDILPEVREYERTSTTVINSYVGPIIERYLKSLDERLTESRVKVPLRVMQSNGGVMSARRACVLPAYMVESGPAAGVIAAQRLAERLGIGNLITFDMGGTTAKASVIEDGLPGRTTEYEVGSGITLSSRLVKGSGHALKLPVIDLAEVGAGGGSLVRVDPGGALKVGPESAGAVPGPACYGAGGDKATVTDANVVLGYLTPTALAGGQVNLHPELARRAVKRHVADPLGMNLLSAAFGVHVVANVAMMRAIKAVTTYRGRDPREFTLLAFGGSGPVHAAHMARELGIGTVLVPPAPGVFSAVGLLEANQEHHFVQTHFIDTRDADPNVLRSAFLDLQQRCLQDFDADGLKSAQFRWERSLDMKYSGQGFELTIPAEDDPADPIDLAEQVKRFHSEHDRTYGYQSPREPVSIVNIRLVATMLDVRSQAIRVDHDTESAQIERRVCFSTTGRSLLSPVITRAELSSDAMSGPVVIDEYDSTVVVPPGCSASLDKAGIVTINIGPDLED